MRDLSDCEVASLERFLVEDNEEAVGISIGSGITHSNGVYSEPAAVRSLSLEELAGGELIQTENLTLCALVGDRLYFRYRNGRVGVIATDDSFDYITQPDRRRLYENIQIVFNTPIVTLPEEQILSRKTILVKNNKRVVGVRILRGSRGIGGSNTSGFCADRGITYTPEELSEHAPIWVEGAEICALANDVLHLRYQNKDGEQRVFTLDYRKRSYTSIGEGIAYDTVSATKVILLLKSDGQGR